MADTSFNDTLNEIGQKIKDTVDGLTKKADEVITIQGLKSKRRAAVRAINEQYLALGKLAYSAISEAGEKGGIPEDQLNCCQIIEEQKDLIEAIETEIEEARIKKEEADDLDDWLNEDEEFDFDEPEEAAVKSAPEADEIIGAAQGAVEEAKAAADEAAQGAVDAVEEAAEEAAEVAEEVVEEAVDAAE